MGFMDELKRLARPSEDEPEDTNEEFEDSQENLDDMEPMNVGEGRKGVHEVLNINTTTQLQVVIISPTRFENASDVADHLREKHTVVLNLEKTEKDIARRLLDFLSGVAYANSGKIKKVANATYVLTPYNVDILGVGDLMDELEHSGVYLD